jgi:hypothetical protein
MVPVTLVRPLSQPNALLHDTYQVVVELIFGAKVVPRLTTVPPEAALYQIKVSQFAPPEAPTCTTPGPQIASGVVVGAAGIGLMVPVTGVRPLSQVKALLHDT